MVFAAISLCKIAKGVSLGIEVVHGLRGDPTIQGDEGGTSGLEKETEVGRKPEE